ncbi:MAG: response regulator [Limnohabitans sp.]|nr:response regulator [Limnohabitans sp.]
MSQDILDLARLENGELVLVREPLRLSDVLASLNRSWAREGPVPGLCVTTRVASDVPDHYWGDAARLVQALMNLLWAFVHGSEQGSLALHVTRLERDRDFENLLLTVRVQAPEPDGREQARDEDPSEAQGHVVELPRSMDWHLAICRQLALLMGGDVQVQDAQAKVPVWGMKIRLQASTARVGPAPDALRRSWPGTRILVVDDHRSIRDIVKHVLELAQVQVDAAENGLMAVEMLENSAYDLVLMDLQMPVMGGIDATRLIRKQQHLQNMPIVALSATGFGDELDRWTSEGMTDHLAKPFDSEQLWTVLERHLSPANFGPEH